MLYGNDMKFRCNQGPLVHLGMGEKSTTGGTSEFWGQRRLTHRRCTLDALTLIPENENN